MAKKKEAATTPKKLRVTLTKSLITSKHHHRDIVRSLGLRRMNHTVEHIDTPVIRGMLAKVEHLVSVEEV
jgi:large subunit ribosomal protein L30